MLTFMIRERHALCQIVKSTPVEPKKAQYELVVFDAFFVKHPTLSDIEGKALYVSRTPPRNQPFYFSSDEEPPPSFRVMGTRAVATALPTSFRTAPTAEPEPLPVHARWAAVTQLLRADFKSRGVPPEPYTSTHFPGWVAVDPPTLRRVDQLIDALTKTLAEGAPLEALKATVGAFNRLEDDIDAPRAEELSAKLCALATAAGLEKKKAAAVIDAVRTW